MLIEDGKIIDSQLEDGDSGDYRPANPRELTGHDGYGYARIARRLDGLLNTLGGEVRYRRAVVGYPVARLIGELAALSGDEQAIAELRDLRPPVREDFIPQK